MLYLQNIRESQEIYVPRQTTASGTLKFYLVSTIDLDTKVNQIVQDSGASSGYYIISVTLPAGMPDGEYEYTLRGGPDKILSSGLLIVGGYASQDSQYNKEITYEQYENQ